MPQRLNEKLNTLIDRGWIKPEGNIPHRYYSLSDKYHSDMQKRNFEINDTFLQS